MKRGRKRKMARDRMPKASKLFARRRGKVLLVKRRRDGLWMFPGGRRRGRESARACMRREIAEELPKLKVGRLKLWKEVTSRNRKSGRRMSDAVFVAARAKGGLAIGDRRELTRAEWRRPYGVRLTATSRYIRDRLCPRKRRKNRSKGRRKGR